MPVLVWPDKKCAEGSDECSNVLTGDGGLSSSDCERRRDTAVSSTYFDRKACVPEIEFYKIKNHFNLLFLKKNENVTLRP